MKTQLIVVVLTGALCSCSDCRRSSNARTVDLLPQLARETSTSSSISNEFPKYDAPVDLSLSWQPAEAGHKPEEYIFFLEGKRIGDIDTLKRYLCTLPKYSRVYPWYNEGHPRTGGTPDFDQMGLADFLKTNSVKFSEARAR